MEDKYGVIFLKLYGFEYCYKDYSLRSADDLIDSWTKARTVRAFAGDKSEKIDRQSFFLYPSDSVHYSAVLDVNANKFIYRSHEGVITMPLMPQRQTPGREQSEHTTRLFVDMDGVLAEFKKTSALEDLYEKGYFYNLKPQMQVVDAIRAIRQDPEIEVFILSSVLTDSKYALAEKKAWLAKYLPEIDASHMLFPPCGDDKWKYVPGGVKKTDCLLDDYTTNLLAWEPLGTGIKLLNGINHSHETWEGAMVSINSPKDELISDIKSHVLNQKEQATKIRL